MLPIVGLHLPFQDILLDKEGGMIIAIQYFPDINFFPKPLLLRPKLHSVLDGTESAKATSALEKNLKSVYLPC